MSPPNVTLVGPLTWRGASNHPELQLGLLSLAAILKPGGIIPQIVDLNLLSAESIEGEALAAVLETDPDIVGFGSICSSYPLTLRLAGEVKRARPSISVILGGRRRVSSIDPLCWPFLQSILLCGVKLSFLSRDFYLPWPVAMPLVTYLASLTAGIGAYFEIRTLP